MINHDAIIQSKVSNQSYIAETDVTVMKYDASTFETIIDQFPNFYKDLKKMVDDRQELEEKNNFKKVAVKDVNIRKIIINHYNNIVNAAKSEIEKLN